METWRPVAAARNGCGSPCAVIAWLPGGGWWSRAGDEYPLLMDIFDIEGDTDDGVMHMTADHAAESRAELVAFEAAEQLGGT